MSHEEQPTYDDLVDQLQNMPFGQVVSVAFDANGYLNSLVVVKDDGSAVSVSCEGNFIIRPVELG